MVKLPASRHPLKILLLYDASGEAAEIDLLALALAWSNKSRPGSMLHFIVSLVFILT